MKMLMTLKSLFTICMAVSIIAIGTDMRVDLPFNTTHNWLLVVVGPVVSLLLVQVIVASRRLAVRNVPTNKPQQIPTP